MPPKHVQKHVINAQKIVIENLKCRNVKVYAEPKLTHVVIAQMNAELSAALLLKQNNNVPMPALPVLKSAKSTTMKYAKNAQKNVESVK